MAQPDGAALIEMLCDARARLLALVADLSDEQLRVPQLAIVNPPLWELGHVGWFQERWCRRHDHGSDLHAPITRPSLRADADALFDSSAVAHDSRWELLLPSRAEVLGYLEAVLDATCARLAAGAVGDAARYFAQLALFHENMHGEALAYTRQTFGWTRPRIEARGTDSGGSGTAIDGASDATINAASGSIAAERNAGPCPGDVAIPGGLVTIGSAHDASSRRFVFDNEKWAHVVNVAPFRIARAAVTQAEFAEFVEAGGYRQKEHWSRDGWAWRTEQRADHPVYWRREPSGCWQRRSFDRWVALEEHRPVLHVSWFEADAWCRWRGRRLPTEAEWEAAASGTLTDSGQLASERRLYPWGDDPPTPRRAHLGARSLDTLDVGALPAGDSAFGCRQMLGNVWEWTASDFEPYPGFSPDPYTDYSQPWFGWHKVLRGGCLVTQPRLIHNAWRNFYTPDRRDVWAGFRSCS